MKPVAPKPQRCAIYTRKSTEHNLDLEFNSLDAQREACEAYIKSQAHEGWRLVPDRYDDGGLSGASLDRAALQKLLADVRAGKITIVVVYKIPWGVDSDQFWGQTEVANPLNLEATNATRSPLRRTDRYPNQSWRNFRLIGTQPFNLADHVAVAGRRREDVEAQRLGSGHRWAAVALFGAQAEGVRADGAILPDHRHSRGGTGWLLDSSGAATEEIESYVVAAAPIATSRRRRRAKTDRIDGEALVRALLAYKRGEPRVCAMVRAPTSEDEDRRRLCRERKTLTVERVQHVNRINRRKRDIGAAASRGDRM